ncbi:hypothetical protein [Chryseobacterium oranimense]|uniref:hypothetical protein n=1 Tax=Chryseobacterium oranimense TaxID=421058 RepID=UPI0031CF5C66
MKNNSLQLSLIFTFIIGFMQAQVGIATAYPGSTLTVNGSFATAYREINLGTASITNTDHYINYIFTGNGSLTLPSTGPAVSGLIPAQTALKGREYIIHNSNSSNLTVTASGSEKIDIAGVQASSLVIPKGYSAYFKSNGAVTTTAVSWIVTLVASANTSRLVGSGLYRNTSAQSFSQSNSTLPANYGILQTSVPIIVPNTGTYSVFVRWWGITTDTDNGTSMSKTSAYVMLYNLTQNTVLDEIEYYVTTSSNSPFTFVVNLLGTNVNAGDTLQIRIRPSVPNNSAMTWKIGTVGYSNYTWAPSVLVIQQ